MITFDKLITTHVDAMRNIGKQFSSKSQLPLLERRKRAIQQMNGVIEVAREFGIDEELYKWKDTFLHDYVETDIAILAQQSPW